MNTKGTRFLAVVAVMALAFTLFVALDPADENMGVIVYDWNDDFVNPEEVTSSTGTTHGWNEPGTIYISEDTTVKMKGAPGSVADTLTFLVQNGVTLTLDFKNSWDSETLKIELITVTGDQEVKYSIDTAEVGKVPLEATAVTFVGQPNTSVYYQAATVSWDVGYDRIAGTWDNSIEDIDIDVKAEFSADETLESTGFAAGTEVAVAPGQNVSFNDAIVDPQFEYGALVNDTNGEFTYYSVGADLGTVNLSGDFYVEVIDAKATVKNGNSSVKIDKTKENMNDFTATTISVIVDNIPGGSISYLQVWSDGDGMALGEMTVSGNIFFREYAFSDGTVTVANKVELKDGSGITVDGTLVLKNENALGKLAIDGTGTLALNNSKLWSEAQVPPAAGILADVDGFDGLIDTTGINKLVQERGNISTGIVAPNQTKEIDGDTTLSNKLDVYGVLIIDEGVTLTVEKGAVINLCSPDGTVVNAGNLNGKNIAQIINYGRINVTAETFGEGLFVNSGKLTNYGTISMSAKANVGGDTPTSTIYSKAEVNGIMHFVNFGNVQISKNDYADLNNFENKATGNVTFGGYFHDASTVRNSGRIAFNSGAEISGEGVSLTIENKGLGATVNISSVRFGNDNANAIYINDKRASFYDLDNQIHKGNSVVTIKAIENTTTSTVRGLNFGQVVDDDDNVAMTIHGNITVNTGKTTILVNLSALDDIPDPGVYDTEYPVGGNFVIEENLYIPAYVKLAFGSSVATTPVDAPIKLVVDAELSIHKDAVLKGYKTYNDATGYTGESYNNVVLFVNGGIYSKEDDLFNGFADFVGARYESSEGDGVFVYEPIATAIKTAILADVDSVDVGYAVWDGDVYYATIAEDISIPAEMSVAAVTATVAEIEDPAKILIGTDGNPVTVTVAESGRISATVIDLICGKIIVEDEGDVAEDEVYAHVMEKDGRKVTYSSLDVAIAEANSGDTIGLKDHFVLYPGHEFTIPAGITVDATDDKDDPTNFIVIDSNLIINGRLITAGFNFVASTDDTKAITVNGFLMNESTSGPATENKWFTPIGVSYFQTITNADNDDVEYFIITGLENIQYAIDASDDMEVTIEGKAKIGNISVSGSDDQMAEITFRKEVNVQNITLNNAKLIFTDGEKINGTFSDAQGAIVIRGAYSADSLEIFSEGEGVYMDGKVVDDEDGTYTIYFQGLTGMRDATIAWGNYDPEGGEEIYPTISFAGNTLATGKKNEIKALDGETYGYDIVTVTGTLTAAGGSRLAIDADVEVLGSLVAADKTDSSTTGTIDISGVLYVGIMKQDFYDAEEVATAGGISPVNGIGTHVPRDANAVSVVSGKINVDKYLVAIAGSNVDEGLVEDYDSFNIYIDSTIWATIWKGEGTDVRAEFWLDGIKAPVLNGKVYEIVNQDGAKLADYNDDYGIVYQSTKPVLFGTDDSVFFNVKYDSFIITIKTDASIKSVYLDGILMKNDTQKNWFYLENQKAGKHVLSVEPVTGYSAANAYLYDDSGVALPGLTFSFDREDCVVDDNGKYGWEVIYNIAGTQQIEPEIVVAGWDITTILLLVLVILIAIMAVIVALRLNRN